MSTGGKGSGRRPTQVTDEEFESNWNNIFKKSVIEDIPKSSLAEMARTDEARPNNQNEKSVSH